jgi:hypothetical protein
MSLLAGPDFELVVNDSTSGTYAHEVHEIGTSRQRLPQVAAAAAVADTDSAVVGGGDFSIGTQVEQDGAGVGATGSAQSTLKQAALEGGGSAAHMQPCGAGKQGGKGGGDEEEGPGPTKHFGDVKALEVRPGCNRPAKPGVAGLHGLNPPHVIACMYARLVQARRHGLQATSPALMRA